MTTLFRIRWSLHIIRGAIKKFLTWPSSVQSKIKTVFASYISKAQNMTCTIWLLGYKYFLHFSGRRFAFDMEKVELRSVMKSQFWQICSFCCMLCCSDSESKLWMHVSFCITSCEINFCWVTSVSFEKYFRSAQYWTDVSIWTPIWPTLCSYTEMHKIFIAQKSHCACHVLSLPTIRSKYYFNFILNRTRSGWEFLIAPRIYGFKLSHNFWCSCLIVCTSQLISVAIVSGLSVCCFVKLCR